jgi:predicted transcriptional regulator
LKVGELMTTISIRIDEAEKELLQKYAKERDLTLSQAVRKAIRVFFEIECLDIELENNN